MSARKRHEHQIGLLNCYQPGGGNTFRAALNRVLARHGVIDGKRRLNWFTDEQIAEIRAEMIESDWFRHKLNRENRKRRTA
jgi:hypothetical protein